MNEVTLVHLVNDETPLGLADVLARANLTHHVEIRLDPDPARTCQRVVASTPSKNLIIIATGSACSQLPVIALAQRASGKQILGYQLISPILPAFTDSWPQAPITAHFPTGSTIPKEVILRGIEIEEFDNLSGFARFIDSRLP